MKYTKSDLDHHLKADHQLGTLNTYLKEIVYGGNDGIITTFAVVAGFAGANSGSSPATISMVAVLLFGLANLFADAASMGLGNYLSIRSHQDMFRSQKLIEKKQMVKDEKEEITQTLYLLKKKGFTDQQAKDITNIYSQNKPFWTDFMMTHELGLTDSSRENPILTGLATFISFIAFGIIPLVPYFLLPATLATFEASILFAFSALIILGILRWKITKESVLRSVGEVLLVGITAGSIAFAVGTFFKSA